MKRPNLLPLARLAPAVTFALGVAWTSAAQASPWAAWHPPEKIVVAANDPAPATDGDYRVVRVRAGDRVTASSRRIGADQIATTPRRSAEDLLRLVPGLLIVQHGNQGKGYQFYVRGFDAVHGADLEFTLGQIPINEPSNIHAHGYLDLAFVIPEVVRQIDATKGAFGLRQGNFATAASIRYELGVPKPMRGTRVSYEVGSTNRHRVAVVHAPRRRGEETFIAGEAMFDGGYGENRRAERLSTMGQLRLFERDGYALDALASLYRGNFGLPGTVRLDDVRSGRTGFYDAYTAGLGGRSDRALVGLRVRGQDDDDRLALTLWGRARRLRLDENYTGFLAFPTHGDAHRQVQDSAAVGIDLDFERGLGRRTRLLLGGGWRGDAIDAHEDRLDTSGAVWGRSRDLSILQHGVGLAPGVRVQAAPWLLLEGGARVDVFDFRVRDRMQANKRFGGTLVQVSPRFAARATIRERWQLFAAYGRGLRSPEARAFTLPSKPPENAEVDEYAGGKPFMTSTDNAEVGARVQPSELFDVGMSAFGIWIGRESVFDHVSGFNVELGATRRLGVEADVQVHPTRWLDLGVDVTAVHGRFVASGGKIAGAPPVFVQLQGALVHPLGFRAGLRWFVLGPRPLAYGAKAGAATVVDASIGYRMRWAQIDLSVDNVIGTKWREGEYNFASWWDQRRRASKVPSIQYVAGPPRMFRVAATVFF